MERLFAITHIDGRVLRGDGKLCIEQETPLKNIPHFTTREDAMAFLGGTKLIPEQYKARYFRVVIIGWRSM